MRFGPKAFTSVHDREMTDLRENLIQRFKDKFHKTALGITGGSFLGKLAAFKGDKKTLKWGLGLYEC